MEKDPSRDHTESSQFMQALVVKHYFYLILPSCVIIPFEVLNLYHLQHFDKHLAVHLHVHCLTLFQLSILINMKAITLDASQFLFLSQTVFFETVNWPTSGLYCWSKSAFVISNELFQNFVFAFILVWISAHLNSSVLIYWSEIMRHPVVHFVLHVYAIHSPSNKPGTIVWLLS